MVLHSALFEIAWVMIGIYAMSVGSVGGQFVVLGWLFSEKGISVRNNDKAPSQRVVCQTVANGTGHKPYTILVTCPYYVGFRVKLVYRPGIGVAYIPCRNHDYM